MGTIGKRNHTGNRTEYTEKSIQKILRNHFMSPNSMKYRIENLKVYSWESDSLSITKSGYVYECEIKISRTDFFNDKKKERKHQILEGTYIRKPYEKKYPDKPNYFYYVVPEGLVTVDEVPNFAGLIYITEIYPYVKVIKTAPKISDDKIDEDKLELKEKFYYNYINWKYKAEEEYENTIDNLRKELHESKYDSDGKYHKLTIAEAEKAIHNLEALVKVQEDMSNDYRRAYMMMSNMCNNLRRFLREKGVNEDEIKERIRKFHETYDEEHD